jgi:hypothetical protein
MQNSIPLQGNTAEGNIVSNQQCTSTNLTSTDWNAHQVSNYTVNREIFLACFIFTI